MFMEKSLKLNKKESLIILPPSCSLYRVNYYSLEILTIFKQLKINTKFIDFNYKFFNEIFHEEINELKNENLTSSHYQNIMNKIKIKTYGYKKNNDLKTFDFGRIILNKKVIKNNPIFNINYNSYQNIFFICNNPNQLENAIIITKEFLIKKPSLIITYTNNIYNDINLGIKSFKEVYFRNYKELLNVNEVDFNIMFEVLKKIKYKNYILNQIPIEIGDSCYYGKCYFCDKGCKKVLYNNIEEIVKYIKRCMAELNIQKFKIIDDAFVPDKLIKFAKLVKRLNIKWTTNIRLDKIFTNINKIVDLKGSGCIKLFFGVESFSQKILNLMNKGTIIENIEKILKNFKTLKISVTISLLIDYPFETIEDLNITIKNTKKYLKYINNIELNKFVLTKNSFIYNNSDKFKIDVIGNSNYFVKYKKKSVENKNKRINDFVKFIIKKNKLSNDWQNNYEIWK